MPNAQNGSHPRRTKCAAGHPDAVAARSRVSDMIDAVPPKDLVEAIKRAPSLRGMILGYVAEEVFEKHIRLTQKQITEIVKHDDHDRTANKSDRTITYHGRTYSIQLKSIQTNSIKYSEERRRLEAVVQNDGSDRRTVHLKDGSTVETTLYRKGDYDILAVPLFPFSATWEFAYKRNQDCRECNSRKYTDKQKAELLSSLEPISYPLDETWSTDLPSLLDKTPGRQAGV